MICDSTCLITNVEAKWPGSVHDSRIFRESTLCHSFEQGIANLISFRNCLFYVEVIQHCTYHILGHYDGLLIGDRGYACKPYLMTPYAEPAPGPQARFNEALAQTRARIEMTFGQLKARFRCMRGLRVAPDRACDITVACAVLHNVATIRKERIPVIMDHPEDDLEPVHLDEQTGRLQGTELPTIILVEFFIYMVNGYMVCHPLCF